MAFADEEIVLGNGVAGERVAVPTANPTGFYQAITESERMEAGEIRGCVFFPPGEGPWPVVIVVPGSLGVAPSHVFKAELLTDAGIAACLIDPFGGRGVTSTVANQAQYSFAASAWDVLAAATLLHDREDIDPTRIGAQGHSRGGSAVLSAACMAWLIDTGGVALHAVYAAYPWCGQQFERPDVGETVVRAVIGDQDEWCLPQQVQAHMHAMRLAGCEASFRLFPGAHHSFDRDTPVELIEDGVVAPGAPTIYLRSDGAAIHPATGVADPELSERETMIYALKAGYARRGVRIGTEADFAQQFHDDMMAFWRRLMVPM
ncbi:MAG: prolyl oligopeptidase family serine peptidase [Gammaproteobacteria bacterium]|nr:prolyl oligopeptidase family serine peptidase [Gammaproteobacteria bacterium]